MNVFVWAVVGLALITMITLGMRAMVGSDFDVASRRLHEEIKLRKVAYSKRLHQLNLFLSLLAGGAVIMMTMTVVSLFVLIHYSSQDYWQIDYTTNTILFFAVVGCIAATVILGYQAAVTVAKKKALYSVSHTK